MTTDTQLAPTDDEIDALNDQFRWDTTEGRRALARAVLARWGQPAHSGEPVAYYQPDDPSSSSAFSWPGSERNTAHNKPLFTAPQPVEREPLTVSQIRDWWASENGLEDCEMCKLTDFLRVVRAVEEKHGIKGDQHGTE